MSDTGNKKFLAPRNKILETLLNPKLKTHLAKNDITLIPDQSLTQKVKVYKLAKAG